VRILKDFFGWITGTSPSNTRERTTEEKLKAIEGLLPMLSHGEVLIIRDESGNIADLFCIDELTPEQVSSLNQGHKLTGFTVLEP
jgi:hypothetical protein